MWKVGDLLIIASEDAEEVGNYRDVERRPEDADQVEVPETPREELHWLSSLVLLQY